MVTRQVYLVQPLVSVLLVWHICHHLVNVLSSCMLSRAHKAGHYCYVVGWRRDHQQPRYRDEQRIMQYCRPIKANCVVVLVIPLSAQLAAILIIM